MQFPSLDFADFIFTDVGPHSLLSIVYFTNWLVDTEARFDSGSIPLARWKEIIYSFIRKHILSCLFFGRPNWLYGMSHESSNNSSSKQTGTPVSFWNISSHCREGNGTPLQCSCLENPRDGGAWWAAVCGVAQSQTRLKWFSSSSSHWCSMSTSIIHQWLQNGDIPLLSFMKCNSWSLYKENFPTSLWFSNARAHIRKLR